MSMGFKKFIGRWCAYLWFGGSNLFSSGFTKKGTGGTSGISSRVYHNGWKHWSIGGEAVAGFEKYGWDVGIIIKFFTINATLHAMIGFERPEYKEYMKNV